MERVFPVLHRLIGFYPFFRRFFASTNFSYPDWPDKVFDLLRQFSSYAPRRFDVHLQLSLDGPEHITDQTRGKGVTGLCLQNYDRLLERADEIPENVSLFLAFKPTLSIDTMYQLDTKDKIISYYRFFEDLIQKVVEPLQSERELPRTQRGCAGPGHKGGRRVFRQAGEELP